MRRPGCHFAVDDRQPTLSAGRRDGGAPAQTVLAHGYVVARCGTRRQHPSLRARHTFINELWLTCAVTVAGILFTLVLCSAHPAFASVRVVDDEVFFTLKAPGAQKVFLVGDFNNWNPTVERMPRLGGVFEISLYLVEGSYRYKFVVDGKWIVDPDNPGVDPARGSPLVLVEKPAGLALKTTDPEEVKKSHVISPKVRYIGEFRWEDGDFESDQILDCFVGVEREDLRANALLKTTESSWDWNGQRIDVTVDRGFLATKVNGVRIRAFANDTVWTSTDPLGLVGDLGIYDYNAGYDRKGVAVEFPVSEAITVNGVYADHDGAFKSASPDVDENALTQFVGGVGEDTTLYSYDHGVESSDVFGFEVFVDAHDFQLGYTRRHNHGEHRGFFAEIERVDSLFAHTVYDTRENVTTAVYWLRIKRLLGVDAVFGFGRGESRIHKLNRGEATGLVLSGEELGRIRRSDRVDTEFTFETSNRYLAGIDYQGSRLVLAAEWDRTSFAFEPGVYRDETAVINRSTLRADYNRASWRAGCVVRYTDQAYKNTPADLVVDSPTRNMWLDGRDNFGIADIAAFDVDSYADVGLNVVWGTADPDQKSISWLPTSLRLDAGIATDGFFRSPVYTSVRLGAEKVIRDRYVVLADGRAAAYNRDEWPSRETFLSGYVEVGYKSPHLEVNLGYGFDPVVFDPVVNEYRDIGRTEHLRRALDGGVERGNSHAVGERLILLERALEDAHVLKLECILSF